MKESTLFVSSSCPVEDKLENFPKYTRRQNIARFLAKYELFKRQLRIKGSIAECGVHHGGGLMTWAKISATLEPYNYHRKIFGFDTYEGFPSVDDKDSRSQDQDAFSPPTRVGTFKEGYQTYQELSLAIQAFDGNRFLNQIEKVRLINGDANKTIPEFLEKDPHVLISLLYLDFDVYEPTVTALRRFLPRMPKGAILAFDELNNANWPGETVAVLEELKLNHFRLECFEFEPNLSFIQL